MVFSGLYWASGKVNDWQLQITNSVCQAAQQQPWGFVCSCLQPPPTVCAEGLTSATASGNTLFTEMVWMGLSATFQQKRMKILCRWGASWLHGLHVTGKKSLHKDLHGDKAYCEGSSMPSQSHGCTIARAGRIALLGSQCCWVSCCQHWAEQKGRKSWPRVGRKICNCNWLDWKHTRMSSKPPVLTKQTQSLKQGVLICLGTTSK